MSRSPRFRCAVVGAGIAGGDHLEALQTIAEIEVVAVADRSEQALARMRSDFGVRRLFKDYREMLAAVECDYILVTTPADSHHEIAIEALRRGIHVLSEKPMADTSPHARQIMQAVRPGGPLYACLYAYRFHPEFQWLRRALQERRFGNVLAIRYLRYEGSAPVGELDAAIEARLRRFDAHEMGIMTCTVHAFDLLEWITVACVTIEYAEGWRTNGFTHPNALCIHMKLDGASAVYDQYPSWRDGHDYRLLVIGEQGGCCWTCGNDVRPSVLECFGQRKRKTERLEFPIANKQREQQHRLFVKGIETGKLPPEFPTAHAALRPTLHAEATVRLLRQAATLRKAA